MAKILVAGRDRAFQGRVLEIIKTLDDHEVIGVSDGLKALAQVHSGPFDLLIFDSDLPYLDSLGLLEASRKRHPQTSVILTAESDDFDQAREAIHLGAFELLRRPFEKGALRDAIAAGLEETRQMRSGGYAYKDLRRNDPALIKDGIITAAGDSIISGMAFFVAFLLAAYIGIGSAHSAFINMYEPFMLGLGLSSCYAFAFILNRSYRTDLFSSRPEQVFQLVKNLTLAYVCQIAILFFVRDANFQPDRVVMAAGYVLGLAALTANRFLLLPSFGAARSREGKKQIIIKGLDRPDPARSKTVESVPSSDASAYKPGPHSRMVSSADDYRSLELERHVDEVYISEKAFSPHRVADLVERFRGRQLKIVVANDEPGRKPQNQTVST